MLERTPKVAIRAFVLPAEMSALPDIRPAVAGAGARGTTFEAVVFRVVRRFSANKLAQVEEEGLRTGPLRERVVAPFGDELGGRHGQVVGGFQSMEA